MGDTLGRISLRQAAKVARKSERFIRTKLIDGGHLRAWREGSAARPRFLVMPEEVGPAILAATEYTPPAPANVKRAYAARRSADLHPDVRC